MVRGETLPAVPRFRNALLSVGTWELSVKVCSVQGWAISEQTLIID